MTAVVRPCLAVEAEARLPELGTLLADAVARGASMNFMAGFTAAEGEAFWRGQLPGLRAGERRLLVAEGAGRLVGMVVLSFAPQPNGPHRAEIGKMLVHSSHRRQGLGRRLLKAAEGVARDAGRTLLLLDTEAGSAGPTCMKPADGRVWPDAGSFLHAGWALGCCRILLQGAGTAPPPRRRRMTDSAPAAGHNGGPPLDDGDPGAASWRQWCWTRARKRAWAVPREVALSRLRRAEELGMSYREYALEIMERGRYL